MRRLSRLISSMERSRGVFLSSASPPYEKNSVGMQRVLSFMKAKLVGSHAVYPLASKVGRRPPEGKLEASGSLMIRSLPENSITGRPSGPQPKKPSCFSAVTPVRG